MEGGQSSNSGASSLIPIREDDSALPNRGEIWKHKIAEATAYIEEYLKNKPQAPSVKDLFRQLQRKTQEAHDTVIDVLNDSAIDKQLLLSSRKVSREKLKLYDALIVATKALVEMHKEELKDKAKLYLEQRDASLAGLSQRGSDEGFVDHEYFSSSDEERDHDHNKKVEKYANGVLRINEVMKVLSQSHTDALGISVVLIGDDFGLSCLEESSRIMDMEEGNAFVALMMERLHKLSRYTNKAHYEAEKLFNDSLCFHQQDWKEAAKLFQSPETSPYSALKGAVTASVMAHDYCLIFIICLVELELKVAQKDKEMNDLLKEIRNLKRQINFLH